MAKKLRGPYRKFPKEFQRTAVERMAECDNIGALAKELEVPPRTLYKWRDRFVISDGSPAPNGRELTLRKENSELKRVLADKTLEVDFFRGALQKVEARRQQSVISGGTASTTKSGK